MKNPWDNDPPVATASPWDNDPVVSSNSSPAPSGPLKMTVGQQLMNHPINKGAAGLVEGALALGGGLATQISGGLSGVANVGYNLLKGKSFDDAMQSGTNVINATTDLAYQPRTAEGQAVTHAATYLPMKAVEGWKQIGGAAGEALGNRDLGETLGGGGMEALMAVAPGPKLLKQASAAAARAAEPSAASTYPGRQSLKEVTINQADSGAREARAAAQRQGMAVDLPQLDEGVKARITRGIADPEHVHQAFSEANKGKPEMQLKTAVGIEPEQPLTHATIQANLERLSGPKNAIMGMDGIFGDAQAIAEIRGHIPQRTAAMGREHAAAVELANNAIKDVSTQSGTGAWAIKSIESLRKAARDILGRNDIDPELRNTAGIYKGTADAIEGMIERRLAKENPKLLEQYQTNRQGMAQTYLLQDILDLNTEKLNLGKLANMTKNDPGITGAFQDFGKIYANSPEIFEPIAKESPAVRFSRWTLPGAMGALAGTVVPFVGPYGGAFAGTLAGRRFSKSAARKLASPEYQSRGAAPTNLTREQAGYQPVPEPLAIEPRSPHPLAQMGGTIVGTGPKDTGIINLAPQLNAGMASEGTGPGAILRQPSYGEVRGGSAQFDPTKQSTPQMSPVEIPLTPDKPQMVLQQFYDAMSRGDEAAMTRLQAQYDALLAEGQVPNPVHTPLYEAPSFVPRPQKPPFMPDRSGSPFAEALRNLRGAE